MSEDLLKLFRETGALLDGHFVLRSGLHSRQFFQCALLLQHTDIAAEVCGQLADKLRVIACDAVISPALGGIVVGQEVGRSLGKRHIFAEKADGGLVLRRGFEIAPNERFIVAEDVVTRGGRVQETIDIVRAHRGQVVGVGVIAMGRTPTSDVRLLASWRFRSRLLRRINSRLTWPRRLRSNQGANSATEGRLFDSLSLDFALALSPIAAVARRSNHRSLGLNMKTFLCLVLSLGLCACHHAPSRTANKAPDKTLDASSSDMISARPNPVPPGPGKGETTINWNAGTSSWGQVYVSTNGKPEQPFASGKSGEKKAPWIQTGGHYDFRLYEGKDHQRVLGKVEVTRHS